MVAPSFFLNRPILSTVISLFIVLVGYLALKVSPVAQYPDLIPPMVSVAVSYPGASAQTIAETVVAPLETEINGVEDMLYMTSISASGSGSATINVYFNLGTDPDIAQVNVNNRVQMATAVLPEEVRRQGVVVRVKSPSLLQLVGLYSPGAKYDNVFVFNYMQINVVDELKRVPGVGDASLFGSLDYAMRIWILPDVLAKYGLVPSDISKAIGDQNLQFAPGRIGASPADKDVQLTWQIDTQGRLVDEEEFRNIVIRITDDGQVLRLGDVARIELGGVDYSVDAEMNGNPVQMAGVYLLPGANALETGELVAQKLKEVSARFPVGIEYDIPFDTNLFVEASIDEVVMTLIEAMILVFLVVFVFLQNIRATLIPCLAVPVSIIGTFAGMYALGYSVNTLTLFGLVLSIGIVVDDAIVVLENVERIMASEGLPPREATAKAMSEVTGPVVAIVLVLCAVFIPVSFMGGLAGQMYKQFAVTITISVILSGIVALTLTPALCVMLLKPHDPNKKVNIFFQKFDIFFLWVTHKYLRGVRFFKDSAIKTFSAFIIMIVVMAYIFQIVPTAMVPNEDQGYMVGLAILPDGASRARTDEVMEKIAEAAMANPLLDTVVTISGIDITSGGVKSNYGTYFAVLKPWSERQGAEDSISAFVKEMGQLNASVPAAVILGFEPPPISGMSTTGGFEGYIQNKGADSLTQLSQMADVFIAEALKHPAIGSAQNVFTINSPELYAELDRERCLALGVNVSAVFSVMQSIFGTTYVNDFNKLGRTFKVLMQADSKFRSVPDALNDAYVRSDDGSMIPLNALITFQRRISPQVVERYNAFPSAHILGNPAPGYTSGQAMTAIEEVAAKVLTSDYTLSWASSSLQEKMASSDTVMIFMLSLLMVFLILAAQYESWALPIAVLSAVPFGIFGAISATWMRGLSNDVYFQVALVTLIGLAAKNAILIVEFAAEAWKSGKSLDVAAMYAARTRFRPIVMTSLAFIFGVVPLAISTGAGANSRHAIGTAVIGGMLVATCVATLFVPYFFKFVMSISLKLKGIKDNESGYDTLRKS